MFRETCHPILAAAALFQPAVICWQLAADLIADVRHLEQRIAAVETRIKMTVA